MAQCKMWTFYLITILAIVAINESSAEEKRATVYYSPAFTYYFSNDRSESKTYDDGCSISYKDPDGDCIPGTASIDYPVFAKAPKTGFSCSNFPSPGYYADIEAGCQVFHICELDGRHHTMLCTNGTIFNQKTLACDWWYNTDCFSSGYYYIANEIIFNSPATYTQPHGYNRERPYDRPNVRPTYEPPPPVQLKHYGTAIPSNFDSRYNSENYENVITSTTPKYNQFDHDIPTRTLLNDDSQEYDSQEIKFPENAFQGYWALASPSPANIYDDLSNPNNPSHTLVLHYDSHDSGMYDPLASIDYKINDYPVRKRQSQTKFRRNKKSLEKSSKNV